MKEKKVNKAELKALVTLLDDEDKEVLEHVENKIKSLGHEIIPHLESHWETIFNPLIQKRLEDIIHSMPFNRLLDRLTVWKDSENHNFWA